MTLIILDSRIGQQVMIMVPIRAAVRQPEPAVVIDHPRFAREKQAGLALR